MNTFGDAWDNAEPVAGEAEVIPAGDYTVECINADVNSSDRLWTLWQITTGPEAGTTFFGSSYGLKASDPAKAKKVAGFFKQAMISFGVTEQFFRSASSLADFAEAIKGVQGEARVSVRVYKGGDGDERQSNEIKRFTLTARPPLPSVGGIPAVAVLQPTPQALTTQPTAPAVQQVPVLPGTAAPVAIPIAIGVPGTPDGPPPVPVGVIVDDEPAF
jgi:hypothetical protein